ncbi:MAG: hypothetical protein LAT51_13575 [Flavobacteriaceae bacterium]|nr:hypothetical protein [Flavobacteriaceae bacterium]
MKTILIISVMINSLLFNSNTGNTILDFKSEYLVHQDNADINDLLKGNTFVHKNNDRFGSYTMTIYFSEGGNNTGKLTYQSQNTRETDNIVYEIVSDKTIKITWKTGFSKGKSERFTVNLNNKTISSATKKVYQLK